MRVSKGSVKYRRPMRQRKGFVLAMALVLIAVSGMALAGLARQSLQLVQQATAAQEDLERRWGISSCRQVLLTRADLLIMQGTERLYGESESWLQISGLSGEFTLGQLGYRILLADEDAKMNLNTLYQRDRGAARQAATWAFQTRGVDGFSIRMLPPDSMEDQSGIPAFRSWGEVYELAGNDFARDAEQAIPQRLRDATHRITCWGKGRINIRRADDDTIRTACLKTVASKTVNELLKLRREPDIGNLNNLLHQLTLKNRERAALRRLITDQSQCYSLWIEVNGPRRSWTILTIDRPGLGSPTDALTFTW